MNNIMLHGKLGQDPKLSQSKNGDDICKFSIATDNGKDKPPTWHNCTFFKRQATLIAEHFKKGSEIVVIGKQENTKYEGKYYSNVIGLSFDFCGSKKDSSYTDKEPDYSGGDEDNSDIPF